VGFEEMMAMSKTGLSIVVGVDGSEGALQAARWAGEVAARFGDSLHLVHVMRYVDDALLVITAPQQADAGAYPRELGHALLDRVADSVRADHPKLRISRTLAHDAPEEVLGDLSRRARLVVLSCPDVSRGRAVLVGSTTLALAKHSACPVVAWRGEALAPTDQPIVVGIDDDASSWTALVTAFGLAEHLGVGLTVVRAISERPPADIAIGPVIDREEQESDARQRLSESSAPVQEQFPHVSVRCVVESGKPSRVILRHAFSAQLVVVGNRGRGRLAGALMGSTGLHLLHKSSVPVVLCPASDVGDRWLQADDQSRHQTHAGSR
jgi:nucleotide-binding universal stress UspA family protein